MIPPTVAELTDGEIRLIEVLGESKTTQRTLARAAGLSLGMTNLLIKRLVKKGLIKVVTLNGRTLTYMLTPRGFSEKLKRSYDYVTASIRYIDRIRTRIPELIQNHEGPVCVVGTGELAQLTQETLKQIGRRYAFISDLSEATPGSLCLFCRPELPVGIPNGLTVELVLK